MQSREDNLAKIENIFRHPGALWLFVCIMGLLSIMLLASVLCIYMYLHEDCVYA